MLLSRWKDIFSRDFWKRSKKITGGSALGFFTFWNFILSVLVTVVLGVFLFGSTEFLEGLIDDNVNDFKVELSDGELTVEGLPDPFVLSEYLDDDSTLGVFKNEEFARGFNQGFKEEFVKELSSEELIIDGRAYDISKIDFIVDTKNERFEGIDSIDKNKDAFYFFKNSFVVVDTNPEAELPPVEVTYEQAKFENFMFSRDSIEEFLNTIDGPVYAVILTVAFFAFLFMFIVLRLFTNLWWALIMMFMALIFGKKTTYSESYLVSLHYMVPITIIELFLVFTPLAFTTLLLVVIFGCVHASSSEVESV